MRELPVRARNFACSKHGEISKRLSEHDKKPLKRPEHFLPVNLADKARARIAKAARLRSMKIRLLSTGTINRIAAGEVVERPASALKELIENALDANATRIDIWASKGGAELILVEDNGEGMESPDL